MAVVLKETAKTDYELFYEYKKTNDSAIRNEIAEKYIYIAEILSRRFINRGVDYDDIFQVANMGILYAIERFDPDRGVAFASFATPTVLGEIRRYFRDKGSFIKIPRGLYEIFYKAERIKRANEADSMQEIARLLNLSEQQLNEAYKIGDAEFIKSLEDEAHTDGQMTLSNVVGAEDNHFLMIENKDFIDYCLNKLSEDELKFVDLRYYKNKSQAYIAKAMNISQMQVSRFEKKLLKKLRDLYFKN